MAVVRTGVVAYMRWRECGYVRSDGSVDELVYWDKWKKKRRTWDTRTMALNKARVRLNSIRVDADFYHRGIKIYLKILGYENQTDWVYAQIASRYRGTRETDSFDGCG